MREVRYDGIVPLSNDGHLEIFWIGFGIAFASDNDQIS